MFTAQIINFIFNKTNLLTDLPGYIYVNMIFGFSATMFPLFVVQTYKLAIKSRLVIVTTAIAYINKMCIRDRALPVISFVLVKLMRIPMHQKGLYMFMTIFSNTGFMGYPIMKALFGNDAVFYTALFNILFNLEVFTLGVILINYGNDVKMKLNPKNLLSPGVVASIIAIFIYFLEIPIPDVIANSCGMVGDMTTPLAMMIIGATLANIKVKELSLIHI